MKPWRAEEVVLDGVESRPPGHAPNGGAGRRRVAWRACRAVLGCVNGCSFGRRQGAGARRAMRGDLYGGDTFAIVVSVGQWVQVMTTDRGERRRLRQRHRELGGHSQGRPAHLWAAGYDDGRGD